MAKKYKKVSFKKEGLKKSKTKIQANVVSLLIIIIASYVSVKFSTTPSYIIGIILLIAFLYGVVKLYKTGKFIF